jgi:hypothetical protein
MTDPAVSSPDAGDLLNQDKSYQSELFSESFPVVRGRLPDTGTAEIDVIDDQSTKPRGL